MNEQQVRDRVSATADTIDCSPVPLAAIKRTGRTIVRRRTRARVVGAATIVGAVGLAVAVPIIGLADNKPAPATEAPSTGLGDCPPGVSRSDGGDCDAIPGVREEQYEPTRRELATAGPAQQRAFEDSRVTKAEYHAGFERYKACLADQGYLLSVADVTGPIISYTVPGAAVDSGVDRPCYTRHFRLLDITWQLWHEEEARD